MTIVVKKVPKCLRGIVKLLFGIKSWKIITILKKNNLNRNPSCERIKFWQGRFYLKGKGAYTDM